MQLNKIIGLASQTFNSDVNVSGLELEAVFVPNASQDLISLELLIHLSLMVMKIMIQETLMVFHLLI